MSVLKESSWHWAWNIYTFGLHHNWPNGKEVLNLSYSRLAQLIQERGAVCQNYLMDQNPNRSFALLRSGLVCRRGSRASRVPWDIKNADMLKEPFNRTIDVFPHFLIFFFSLFFSIVRSFYREIVRKVNSNRFISRLMEQNRIRIDNISALTFMPSTGLLNWFFITVCDFLEFWILKGLSGNSYLYGRFLFMNTLLKFCM